MPAAPSPSRSAHGIWAAVVLALACGRQPPPTTTPEPAAVEPEAAPAKPRPGSDLATLREALGLEKLPARGFVRPHDDGETLWLKPGEDEWGLPEEMLLHHLQGPASACLEAAPTADGWLLFDGERSRAIALAEPPQVIAFDTEQRCLVAWPIEALPVPAEGAPSVADTHVELHVYDEEADIEDRKGELQAELDERHPGLERVEASLEEDEFSVRVLDAEGELLTTWIDEDEPCVDETVTIEIEAQAGRTAFSFDHDCENDSASDHHDGSGTRVQRLAWSPRADDRPKLEQVTLITTHDDSWWDWESDHTSDSAAEYRYWPVSGGRLVRVSSRFDKTTTSSSCEEGVDPADEPDDSPRCCTQVEHESNQQRGWWLERTGPRPKDEGDQSQLWLDEQPEWEHDNSGCAHVVEELLATGVLGRHESRLWWRGDGEDHDAMDAMDSCTFSPHGAPPLELPTEAELRSLHAAGLVPAGRYWIDAPPDTDESPLALELPDGQPTPEDDAELPAVCVEHHG